MASATTITSDLTSNDAKVLSALFDPEASLSRPDDAAAVDDSLPSLPHFSKEEFQSPSAAIVLVHSDEVREQCVNQSTNPIHQMNEPRRNVCVFLLLSGRHRWTAKECQTHRLTESMWLCFSLVGCSLPRLSAKCSSIQSVLTLSNENSEKGQASDPRTELELISKMVDRSVH